MKPIFSHITLSGLELPVHLGWPDTERADPQIVRLDVHFSFPEPPLGCTSDHLNDTQCYDALVSQIKVKIFSKPFRLIEHLGHEIYQTIKAALSPDIQVSIRVKKQTEIPHLTAGVTFYYGDENNTW
ncbi:MAG: dihydroneopterin aldolase [Gammaproteobacteria bacterium]|nr:dihydroneopterin aldolase [Gammaproteobacteria bacterium]